MQNPTIYAGKISFVRIVLPGAAWYNQMHEVSAMNPGTVIADLHGKNKYQAKVTVDALLRRAGGSTYRLRLIHGYHGGTELRDFIRAEYGRHPKVKRLLLSSDGGSTELVLREY